MKLFTTGFLQVFFVVINTYFISKGYLLGIIICGFIISFIWSHNVKKIAFGSEYDRFTETALRCVACAQRTFSHILQNQCYMKCRLIYN